MTAAMKLRHLLLGKKAMTSRQHIKKQRQDFADKGLYSQSYAFSSSLVWMWELDYKAEHWRIGSFELWSWKRLLSVSWISKRSNQSILKEINPEYSLERLVLKLKLQYFGHWMQRANTLEKSLMLLRAGGEGGDRGWDGWMAAPTPWTWVSANSGR